MMRIDPEMKLISNGHELENSPAKFGELRDANSLIDDEAALRERMAEDGYLLLRGVLDRNVVLAAREEIFGKWAAIGAIDTSYPLLEGIAAPRDQRKEVDQVTFGKDLRSGPAIRELVHRGRIIRFFERFLGGDVRALDYIWIRTVRVGGSTACHYDRVYMGRGTHNLYTSWIPIGDVSLSDGPLLILENSHRLEELQSTYGSMDVDRKEDREQYGGGSLSKNPVEVQERYGGRWLTTEFQAGDLLIFTMVTLHCSLENQSPVDRIRLSSDTRYQLASEPADERWIGADPMAHGPAAQR